MRKLKFIVLFAFLLISLVPKLQTQSLKNKAILQAREMGDTLLARLNNKLYYTLKTSDKWSVVNGKIAFHTFTLSDTSPDIQLEYLADKAELVKRLRNGDTIRNCFMADIKLSFSDFTDVQVMVADTAPQTPYKSQKKEKNTKGKHTEGTSKKPEVSHVQAHRKKKTESIPFSKPIVFNNCVFGPIVADTSTDIYQEDALKKKRIEFREDVIMI
ncbi:MAG TPA: hypothetical protein VK809_04205, partial [Bacteroidia bacterium]|nr:hypothetical protein [Bacteroidia bacterium]